MNNPVELTIEQPILDGILSAAAEAGSRECMGLLASGMGKRSRITGACRLPAQASGSQAEADPLAIRQAVEMFRKRRQRPVGLWHSHGSHGVFHSTVDDQTVMRLLPAMAEWNFESPEGHVAGAGGYRPGYGGRAVRRRSLATACTRRSWHPQHGRRS